MSLSPPSSLLPRVVNMADTKVRLKVHKQHLSGATKRKLKAWASKNGIAAIALCFSVATFCLYCTQVSADHKRDAATQKHFAEEQQHYAEEQRRLQIQNTPDVSFEQDADTDDQINGLKIINEGLVPAKLKSITYYVGKKTFEDVDDVVDVGGLGSVGTYQFNHNDILAVGGQEWLLKESTKTPKKALDKFKDFIDGDLVVKAEVCSKVTQQCEIVCSDEGKCK
jgi:hypothetical protein